MKIRDRYQSQNRFSIKHNGSITEGKTIGDVLADFAEVAAVGCDGAINGIKWATTETGDPTGTLKATFETISGSLYLVLRDCNGDIVFQVLGDAGGS